MAIVKTEDTTMANLNELNALRTAAGMKPLKAWKESKAKLAEAITKLQSKTTVTQQLEATVRAIPTVNQKTVKVRELRKLEGVSIIDIAKELKVDPKVARAKLRRRTDVPRLPGKAWTFDASQVKLIKEILRQDNRKKGGE